MAEQSAAARSAYGGQAVIEGVMIRGKSHIATACRLKDGSIRLRHDEADGLTRRYRWLQVAFIRGTPALFDSLAMGYRTLMWSADQAMEGEEQGQQLTPAQQFFSIAFSMIFAIGIFVLLPTAVIGLLGHWVPAFHRAGNTSMIWWQQLIPTWNAILPNLVEGVLRLLLLMAYIGVIARNPEVRRIFAYHGAEHKVVNGYEAGADLSVDAVRAYSRIHPRCGTSFLFLTFVVGVIIHAFIGWPQFIWLRLASRLVLLPLVAGTAYELIRLSGRFRDSRLMRALIFPGLLLQYLTTAEPEDAQIDVALASMRTVLEDEGVLPKSAEDPLTPILPIDTSESTEDALL